MADVVLYVNHREAHCGVHQFGERIFHTAMRSINYHSFYIDIDNQAEFVHWVAVLQPAIVVYNYYTGATMPWLTPALVQQQRGQFKQLCIFHEVPLDHMGFDLLLHQDPSNEDTRFVNLPRPIPSYRSTHQETDTPTFGSFGFGLGGKGFDRLVTTVCDHYDNAIIRLNIPFAAFGDNNGDGARSWGALCQRAISKPGVELVLTHDLLQENDLIDYLSANTCNCFFYGDNYGRGSSGTLDYALAADKPIAITKSWQFKHIWHVDDTFLIENTSLPAIVAMGTEHLTKFHRMWSEDALIASFEHAFRRVYADE